VVGVFVEWDDVKMINPVPVNGSGRGLLQNCGFLSLHYFILFSLFVSSRTSLFIFFNFLPPSEILDRSSH
jgi:hypothetical protein